MTAVGGAARRPLVLVLAGGGSRGAMEVGVLAVLAEHGFQPDHVVGTSAGALNATMVAARPLPEAVERLTVTWDSAATRAVFHASPRELIRNVAARRSWLRDDTPLRHLVRTALADLGVHRFEELRLPLSVVVTDFDRGAVEALTGGDLEDALVASCSVPGVFPAVVAGGRRLVDGGVIENCPLGVAAALEPCLVVAVDVSGAGPASAEPSFLEVVDRTLGLAQRARVLADVRVHGRGTPIALICPRPSRHVGLLEPVDSRHLIELTTRAVRTALATLLDNQGMPRPGVHDIPVDLRELRVPRRRALVRRNPALTAAQGTRLTQALDRARRNSRWIDLRPPTGG